ncbi:MAG: hypothetical protein LKH27_08185 [Prevotella sp.]|jgi:hypothetical protein|nr:hypothetical protein [Prevotella sp.]MCH3993023.1 hypothetical protein [Prevotella sp.]MCI1474376.1 hypothetical protein [Prevotella sp.]MCI1596069.1 hypothetical protein [Prevotella sp.]
MKHEKLYFSEQDFDDDKNLKPVCPPKPMWYYKMYGISVLYEAVQDGFKGVVYCRVCDACVPKSFCGKKKCHDFQTDIGKLLCCNGYKLFKFGKKITFKHKDYE